MIHIHQKLKPLFCTITKYIAINWVNSRRKMCLTRENEFAIISFLFSFRFFKKKMRECALLATYQVVKPFKLYEVISIMGLPLWTNQYCFEYISFHKLHKLWLFMEYWKCIFKSLQKVYFFRYSISNFCLEDYSGSLNFIC